jgi:hypothetical protein
MGGCEEGREGGESGGEDVVSHFGLGEDFDGGEGEVVGGWVVEGVGKVDYSED